MTFSHRRRQWLTRAQRGDDEAVCQEIEELLARPLTPENRVELSAVLAAALYYGRRFTESVEICDRALAEPRLSEGWWSYLLSIRAGSRVDLDDSDGAVTDLIEAEVALTRCDDPELELSIRKSLGASYGELGLFARAATHFLIADDLDRRLGAGFPAGLVNALNLALLQHRWAQREQQSAGVDELTCAARDRFGQAQFWLSTAVERAGSREHPWKSFMTKLEREIRTELDPRTGVPLLQKLVDEGVDTGAANTTAVSLAVLSTGLRRLGRAPEAWAAGRRASELIATQALHVSTVEEVESATHLAEVALGLPGAATAQEALSDLSAELQRYTAGWTEAFQARLHHALADQELNRVESRALSDPLTGLPNRRAWEQWLRDHPVGPVAVVMLDIDGLKLVNDHHGHLAGDLLLSRFGEQMRRRLTPEILIARFGGDEFVLAAAGPDAEAAVARLVQLAEAALSAVDLGDLGMPTPTAATGAAVAGPGERVDGLLDLADQRMYLHKNRTP